MSTLTELAALGGFFDVQASSGEQDAPPWQPMSVLIQDPVTLLVRLEQVRTTLSRSGQPVPLRVAAAVAHLSLVTRVLSPALATAVLSGQLLDLEWAHLRWQPGHAGAFPMAAQLIPDRPANLAADFGRSALHGPMAELITAFDVVCPISTLISWGNVGSALNGAALMLARQRPELAARGYALVQAVLEQPPLSMNNPIVGPWFRRDSCCQLYRASPLGRAAACVDCVLVRR